MSPILAAQNALWQSNELLKEALLKSNEATKRKRIVDQIKINSALIGELHGVYDKLSRLAK